MSHINDIAPGIVRYPSFLTHNTIIVIIIIIKAFNDKTASTKFQHSKDQFKQQTIIHTDINHRRRVLSYYKHGHGHRHKHQTILNPRQKFTINQ